MKNNIMRYLTLLSFSVIVFCGSLIFLNQCCADEPFTGNAPGLWGFSSGDYNNYPYYYPIYGTATVNGTHLTEDDWVGVFDGSGNCYGAGKYIYDAVQDKHYYAVSVYAEYAPSGLTGFNAGDGMHFRFYIQATALEIDAYPNPYAVYSYPDVINGNVDPIEIDLIDSEDMDTFTIIATSDLHGNIIPSGTINVAYDGSQLFTIVPNQGYEIDDVLIGSVSIGPQEMYEFENVRKDSTIHATFEESETTGPVGYSITVVQNQNGSILPVGPIIVSEGESQEFTIIPNGGYTIERLLINDTPVDIVNPYKFENVTGDMKIEAKFKLLDVNDPPPGWNFFPENYSGYPYYYPIYGEALMNGSNISIGDWVGVFDEDGNCYGAGQYRVSPVSGEFYYSISAYAASELDGTPGFIKGEMIFFRYYLVTSNQIIDAVPNPQTVYVYPEAISRIPDVKKINLVNAISEVVYLEKGWNLISFNVDPIDPRVASVFESVKERLIFVFDHMLWWDKTVGGSLTEIDIERSYYVVVTEDCSFNVSGSAVQPSYTRSLEKGWNSIAYHYNKSMPAIGRTEDISIFTGFFKDIVNDVIIVKDANTWCTPQVRSLTLEKGRGVVIKLKNPRVLTIPEE